jgi:hypothetical protein
MYNNYEDTTMAINFSVGDFVVANQSFTLQTLPALDCICKKQTLTSLGYVGHHPSEVLATGTVFRGPTVSKPSVTLYYIHLLPSVVNHPNPARHPGPSPFYAPEGVVIYFCSESHLNNSFELSSAYLADDLYVKVLNDSAGAITKGQVVRQTGFDAGAQLPTVDLADASALATSMVLGIASEDIAIGGTGVVTLEGSFNGIDTTIFSTVGEPVYLDVVAGGITNYPGIATAAVEAVVGKVLVIGDSTSGTISILSAADQRRGFYSDGVGTN